MGPRAASCPRGSRALAQSQQDPTAGSCSAAQPRPLAGGRGTSAPQTARSLAPKHSSLRTNGREGSGSAILCPGSRRPGSLTRHRSRDERTPAGEGRDGRGDARGPDRWCTTIIVCCLAPEDGQGSGFARQHRISRPLYGIRPKASKGLNRRRRVLQNPQSWVPCLVAERRGKSHRRLLNPPRPDAIEGPAVLGPPDSLAAPSDASALTRAGVSPYARRRA